MGTLKEVARGFADENRLRSLYGQEFQSLEFSMGVNPETLGGHLVYGVRKNNTYDIHHVELIRGDAHARYDNYFRFNKPGQYLEFCADLRRINVEQFQENLADVMSSWYGLELITKTPSKPV